RQISYLRVSVTDRCDLRCVYCMPEQGIELAPHDEILSYEEIVRIVSLTARLGVRKVRLTGGEPLVRRNLSSLVERIKSIEGIERICLTTNGLLLSEQLPELIAAGLDSVNISLDAIDPAVFAAITRRSGVEKVLTSIDDAYESGLSVKINCVPTELNRSQIIPMAERFLNDARIPLRFIELMPLGAGKRMEGLSAETVKAMLTERFGVMRLLEKERLAGPCYYYTFDGLAGRIGFISAVSQCFCESCNRVRLTSTGFLKTCLQFDRGAALKPLLAESDGVIMSAMEDAIWDKPERHCFLERTGENLEQRSMAQIGG
ncbi:MAG: GTP 3',8-cyclase MoaA, partial [Spirochaetota bacterium]